jgi:predicted permease
MSKVKTPWPGRLLARLIVGADRDTLRGDLDESFRRRVAERGSSFGVRAAYVFDVMLSVLHVWLATIRQPGRSGLAEDLRYSRRMLTKHIGFTIISVISLSVGIGATTTVFSVLNAALLRDLPVRNPETLVSVEKPQPNQTSLYSISYPDYLDYKARATVFSEILAWAEVPAGIELGDQPEQSYGLLVSGNYFPVLVGRPALGRLITPDDDRISGAHPVTMLSYAFWQRRFGGDSSVVGKRIELNGLPFTVIGVAPHGFTSTYNVFAPAFYVPLTMQPQLTSRPDALTHRRSRGLKVTARLAPGVTREEAQAALSVIDGQIERENPEKGQSSKRPGTGIELRPIGEYPLDIQLALLGISALLMAVVGFVLIIACSNVAGMLLARATVRRREMAVRLALGATRGRLIRQLLTETLALFAIAATIGIALTFWLTRIVSSISLPAGIPFALEASIDWRVLAFTLLLAACTGIVFGLAPALEGARIDLQSAMKDIPMAGAFKRSRVRHAFVVVQIALSLVLLIGAGLLARAFQYAQTVYPGRDPETILVASVDPGTLGYGVTRARAFYQSLAERMSALPGVESFSMSRQLQIGFGYSTTSLIIKDRSSLGQQRIEFASVGPGYFRTVGMRVVMGREFTAHDREPAASVVLITESTARRYWPNESPLGRLVEWGDQTAEIVGVVEDGPHRVVGETPPPFVYGNFLQSQSNNVDVVVLLRYRGDQATMVAALRREVKALDPRMPVQAAATLSSAVSTMMMPWRLGGQVAAGFGLLGLTLAALGIYGLIVYTVNQRTREIGVRVALGAEPGNIRRLFIGHGLRLAAWGVGIGLVISFAMTRALGAFLFGVSASDPLTYVGQSVVLVLVALAASYIPARRATLTDPLIALRHE